MNPIIKHFKNSLRCRLVEATVSQILETPLDDAANKAEPPTENQKESGNYKKGHLKFKGLNVTIENPKGSKRNGTDLSGKTWEVTLGAHYGYLKGTLGKDGDHLDVYIGPDQASENVYVVNQKSINSGAFDEHKIMLGFKDRSSAVKSYDAAFSGDLGRKLRMSVVPTSIEGLKEWIANSDTKKPFYYA